MAGGIVGFPAAVAGPVAGTFTPTIQDDALSDAESQTYSVQSGAYQKIGDLVLFWIDIQASSLGTLTTTQQCRIAGLPFTSDAAAVSSAVTVGFASGLAITASIAVTGTVIPNSTYIAMNKWSATTGTSSLTLAELSSDGRMRISGSYVAA